MKILIINGSPRKNGYTSDLVNLFLRGIRDAGGQSTVVNLRKKNISTCIGCFKCWVGDTPGRCIFRDDMDEILDLYLDCDTLVIATPMYYYSFSSFIKVFLERLFPTTMPGLDLGGVLGLGRNRARFPGKGPSRSLLIACCGLRNPATMKPLVGTFELVCDAISAKPAGVLLRPESNLLDFEQAKPRTMRRVRLAFERAGREIIEHKKISKKTADDAALPFSSNEETFATHFETYWTIAGEMGPDWTNRQLLANAATTDPRIIIRELASYLNSETAGDLKAVIQLIISDAKHDNWHLVIADGLCKAFPGSHDSPDLLLRMSYHTFNDIAASRADVRALFSRGAIQAEGNVRLLSNFGKLFPKPCV